MNTRVSDAYAVANKMYNQTGQAGHEKIVRAEDFLNSKCTSNEIIRGERAGYLRRGTSGRAYIQLARG